METQLKTFEGAAAMPAPTWHMLKMNDTSVELPAGLAIRADARVAGVDAQAGPADAFDRALAFAQRDWEREHPALTAAEQAERAQFLAAEADATYGGTALSAYQARTNEVEESRSLARAFDTGMGAEVSGYIREAAGAPIVVRAATGQAVDAQVAVSAEAGALSVAAVDVVAEAGSAVRLSLLVDGEVAAAADGGAIVGGAATSLRVFAGAGSRVDVVRTQVLGDALCDIDDTGLFVGEDARVDVRQVVLGAGQSHTGLAGDLRGDASEVQVQTSYLGRGEQIRDFNYTLNHHGRDSRSQMLADGVLAGRSRKTLRGTIDLIRGCKGAEGSEKENVLIIDQGVRNKTVPVILCSEDDVAGNHGATIGHIRDEQLFYLASRGLSPQAAERMFMRATLEKAAIEAPDAQTRAAVVRYGETFAPGFSALFEEGDIDG